MSPLGPPVRYLPLDPLLSCHPPGGGGPLRTTCSPAPWPAPPPGQPRPPGQPHPALPSGSTPGARPRPLRRVTSLRWAEAAWPRSLNKGFPGRAPQCGVDTPLVLGPESRAAATATARWAERLLPGRRGGRALPGGAGGGNMAAPAAGPGRTAPLLARRRPGSASR